MGGRRTKEHQSLHSLDFRILMALARAPSYGTAIVEAIEAAEGGRMRLYPANLFRRIRDLLGRGFLEESTAPPGSDPRRTYLRLTEAGREAARAEATRLRELVEEARAVDLLARG